MQTNAGLTHSRWFRIARGVALELLPLIAIPVGWGVLNLGATISGAGYTARLADALYNAVFLVGLTFLISGAGWFVERQPAIGGAVAGVRVTAVLLLGLTFAVALGEGWNCSADCFEPWVEPTLLTSAVIAFAAPIISAVWLAITIAREAHDPPPADANAHFAAEGA